MIDHRPAAHLASLVRRSRHLPSGRVQLGPMYRTLSPLALCSTGDRCSWS